MTEKTHHSDIETIAGGSAEDSLLGRLRHSHIEDMIHGMEQNGYVLDDEQAVVLLLMTELQRPLLLEGDAGVGKTELAAALAKHLGTRFIRLQCYEGLDVNSAIYEWNYQRQLLEIRLHQSELEAGKAHEVNLYGEDFLLKRPLLQSITETVSPVLLIDEIDRADEEFEAFLLEVLSEFQITIPEFGTVTAVSRPHVILTSNATRDLSDALRRRCLYSYVDYPSPAKEAKIIARHIPLLNEKLLFQIVQMVDKIRQLNLRKRPGVAEAIDWAGALMCLEITDIKSLIEEGNENQLEHSLSCLLKTREDRRQVNVKQLASSL